MILWVVATVCVCFLSIWITFICDAFIVHFNYLFSKFHFIRSEKNRATLNEKFVCFSFIICCFYCCCRCLYFCYCAACFPIARRATLAVATAICFRQYTTDVNWLTQNKFTGANFVWCRHVIVCSLAERIFMNEFQAMFIYFFFFH